MKLVLKELCPVDCVILSLSRQMLREALDLEEGKDPVPWCLTRDEIEDAEKAEEWWQRVKGREKNKLRNEEYLDLVSR
jgi:hypothetical protein